MFRRPLVRGVDGYVNRGIGHQSRRPLVLWFGFQDTANAKSAGHDGVLPGAVVLVLERDAEKAESRLLFVAAGPGIRTAVVLLIGRREKFYSLANGVFRLLETKAFNKYFAHDCFIAVGST